MGSRRERRSTKKIYKVNGSVVINNKLELQKMLALTVDENIPMIGMVTRLVSHKGLEMVKKADLF